MAPEFTAFRDDGVACLRGHFARSWIAQLHAGFERNPRECGPGAIEHHPGGSPGRFFEDDCNGLAPVLRQVCPEFVAGPHGWGRMFLLRLFETGVDDDCRDARYQAVPDTEAERGAYRILSRDLGAGDAMAFDFLTLHGAPGNQRSRRRRGLSTRRLGNDARVAVRPGVTSSPFPNIGLSPGARTREDWCPIAWREDTGLVRRHVPEA